MRYTLTGLVLSQDPVSEYNTVLLSENHTKLHKFHHFRIKRCHNQHQVIRFCAKHLGCKSGDIDVRPAINFNILKYKL